MKSITKEYGYKQGMLPSREKPCALWFVTEAGNWMIHSGLSIWNYFHLMARVKHPVDNYRQLSGGLYYLELTMTLRPIISISVDLPFWYTKRVSLLDKQHGVETI